MIPDTYEYTFPIEVKLKGQPVPMLVRFTVEDGNVHLKGKCKRLDTETEYSVANWKRKFKRKAEKVYEQIVSTRMMLALNNSLYKKGDRVSV